MIAFDLECSQGHLFEGWFQSIQSFEKQNAKKLVSCPYCDDTKVRKVLSPIRMKKTSSPEKSQDSPQIDYQRLAREIVDYMNKNFEDVGHDFAKEALKMHYGVQDKKNIRGAATEDEEEMLREEGVQFFKVPVPKDDDDKKN
jgi:hypothetical protein